jgi:hypothetical protein
MTNLQISEYINDGICVGAEDTSTEKLVGIMVGVDYNKER